MSWCRWGSPCQNTIFPDARNDVCPWDKCPGSDIYIYEHGEGDIRCCGCSFSTNGDDFSAKTEEEMMDHIEVHVKAGHHVRPSIRRPTSK